MVEKKIHFVREGVIVPVERIEVLKGTMERFFLTEGLTLDVICNAADTSGRAELEGDLTQVADVSICHKDPSNGDLVTLHREIDITKPIEFTGDDILRIRYEFEVEAEVETEEIHLVHRRSGSISVESSGNVTTPRMRRIMHANLGL